MINFELVKIKSTSGMRCFFYFKRIYIFSGKKMKFADISQ